MQSHIRALWERAGRGFVPPYRRWLLAGSILTLVCLALVIVLSSASRTTSLPDFRAFKAGDDRKSEFFGYITPLIKSENERVLSTRKQLEKIVERFRENGELGWLDTLRVDSLAEEYDVDAENLETEQVVEILLRRVDIVPESLALAQAAKESGWGTSRFAQAGNNLFGEWCYEPGCGIVPRARPDGSAHEVQRFSAPRDSVGSYVRNINTHDSYKSFREARENLRQSGKVISGLALAEQMSHYSERRVAYVEEIKNLIKFNDLSKLDTHAPEVPQ